MEIMVSWYPALKLFLVILCGGVVWFLVVRELWRLLCGFVAFLAFMIFLNPIHVDGTNTNTYDQRSNQTNNNKYEYESTTPKVELHVETFEEQLNKIDKRSETKNEKIQKDLQGVDE